jgi:UDP-GlcNAc:undecaprenyl-phosphate/decaprenyl-phosphate GlcNAc-1-phosphate transferase
MSHFPWSIVTVFTVAAVLSAVLLSVVITMCHRSGLVDRPGGRHIHSTPVPRLGGVAVVLALASALALLSTGYGGWSALLHLRPWPQLAFGAGLVFALGVIDDVSGVAARYKLVVQTVAALVVVSGGIDLGTVEFVRGFSPIPMGSVGPLVTVLWIVGVTNAMNLIDGMDGLAAQSTLLAVGTLYAASLLLGGGAGSALLVAAAVGAIAPFYWRNRSPAKVFLGDSGSMTLGFLLAVWSLEAARGADGAVRVLVPLAALGYPLVDTFVAISRRWLRGHSFSRADSRHIHHQVRALGFPTRHAVLLIGITGVAVSTMALFVTFAPPHFGLLLLGVATFACLAAMHVAVGKLNYAEFISLGRSTLSMFATARVVVRERIRFSEVSAQIASSKSEVELYRAVDALVDGRLVLRVELASVPVTIPSSPASAGEQIYVALPLVLPEGRTLWLMALVSQSAVSVHVVERLAGTVLPAIQTWLVNNVASRSSTRAVYEAREPELMAGGSRVPDSNKGTPIGDLIATQFTPSRPFRRAGSPAP